MNENANRGLFESRHCSQKRTAEKMVNQTPDIASCDFDSSDDDFEQVENIPPLKVDWLDLSFFGCQSEIIGISALPGCKFMHINRRLSEDIEYLVGKGIQDVFTLCTQGEMIRCRVPNLIQEYQKMGIISHHYPMDDFKEPNFKVCMEIVQTLQQCIKEGRKTLLHCVAGVGRTCLVGALLLLDLDDCLDEDDVIKNLKQLRGATAIQTVKQFNMIQEFRELKNKFYMEQSQESSPSINFRSVSR